MLALDSLILDFFFEAREKVDADALLEALGGEEITSQRTLVDPDLQDPRFEMELSPSIPFRQRGEKRIMVIDASVAPMREDPRKTSVVPIDIREEKERLIAACEAAPVRLGRISALGTWGDAVLVAKSAREFRAIALLSWVLDPRIDMAGRRRDSQLSQSEFEEKIYNYEKRLEELNEDQILALMGDANVEKRGDLIIVDLLEEDGTWDTKKSLVLENSLAALHLFSTFPGAPYREDTSENSETPGEEQSVAQAPTPEVEDNSASEAPLPSNGQVRDSLRTEVINGRVFLFFPEGDFSTNTAASIGKKDFDPVLGAYETLPGKTRDHIYENGADFVAPLEFLSEVFLDGKPLCKKDFEEKSLTVNGAKTLEVHYPRFGPILLIEKADRSRFVTSDTNADSPVLHMILQA